MRKNRKVSKRRSVVVGNSMRLGGIMLVLFTMVILNLLAQSSCDQLMKSIGDREKELARLNEDYDREMARWEEMKSPDRLEAALLRHGLSMRSPGPDQVVRMRSDGTPYPGQLSMVRAEQRSKMRTTVQYKGRVRR